MFFKKTSNRVFDYPPRFYNPEKDELEKRKRKLQFSSQRKVNRKKKSPIVWIILIIMIVYIYLKFAGGI